MPLNGRQRGRIERELKGGGEPDGSQHPQFVLGKPSGRVADGPHQAALQIPLAADVIDHAVFQRIEEHAVDREIPPEGILAIVAERHLVRMPAVAVAAVAAKRRDLDLSGAARAEHRDHAERLADGQRLAASKDGSDLFRHRIGRHVVILRLQS
jgi:hypothetical protein